METTHKKYIHELIKLLNVLVLLGSLLIVIVLSLEVLHNDEPYNSDAFMKIQFWVCLVFMLDFWVHFAESDTKLKYFGKNIIFFLVSIPFLNIFDHFNIQFSGPVYMAIKAMPLIRSAYGLSIIVKWLAKRRITNLMVSYILVISALIYFSSIIFYSLEKDTNSGLQTYWDAIWWALMNVSTVGSNIYASSVVGQILSFILAAAGMMMFPIFTVFITTKFQNDIFSQRSSSNTSTPTTSTADKTDDNNK